MFQLVCPITDDLDTCYANDIYRDPFRKMLTGLFEGLLHLKNKTKSSCFSLGQYRGGGSGGVSQSVEGRSLPAFRSLALVRTIPISWPQGALSLAF